MDLVILTSVKLLGDGLADCLGRRPGVRIHAVVNHISSLRAALTDSQVDIVLIDATQGVDQDATRALVIDHPNVALVALGLREQRQDVIRCGRAGFVGYVSRDASMDSLYASLVAVLAGRLECPAEISCGLLRALFRLEAAPSEDGMQDSLTRREEDVLLLIGRGLSNKEIARELGISVATVKHHVHKVLEKLQVSRRAQAMRRARNFPWLGSSSDDRTRGVK
jgi:DNA-binding NarL/FixJ family response regulator